MVSVLSSLNQQNALPSSEWTYQVILVKVSRKSSFPVLSLSMDEDAIWENHWYKWGCLQEVGAPDIGFPGKMCGQAASWLIFLSQQAGKRWREMAVRTGSKGLFPRGVTCLVEYGRRILYIKGSDESRALEKFGRDTSCRKTRWNQS